MNILDIENKRQNLLETLLFEKSPRISLFLITNYFGELLSENNNLTESFFLEFIEDYISFLTKYDPTGIHPEETRRIIQIAKEISKLEFIKNNEQQINSLTEKIEFKLKNIKKILNGEKIFSGTDELFQFPILEQSNTDSTITGLLENVKIVVQKKKKASKDSFTIIPSYIEIEEKIFEQIESSWEIGLKYSRNFVKIKGKHKVVIEFENKYGEYIGDSLGIALVISFIEALLDFYDSRHFISSLSGTAFTGAVSIDGSFPKISDKIIISKVQTCFYSNIQSFIIPREDEQEAQNKYKNLKEQFPNRNLEIIGLKNIKELINRRDVINITKQNIIIWSLKKYFKNKLALAFSFLLILVFTLLAIKDLDYNPYQIESDGNRFFVQNKYGNVLWTINSSCNIKSRRPNDIELDYYVKILDINNDGMNEIIAIKPYKDKNNSLVCYNYEGNEIWEYFFNEKCETKNGIFSQTQTIQKMLATIEINNRKEIVIETHISNWFVDTITKINLATGEKIGDSFWHPGGLSGGRVLDFNNDGKLEIIAFGISNAYERAVIFSIDYDKLSGRAPATENYIYKNQNIADFNHYILLPKTDYSIYKNKRYNSVFAESNISQNSTFHIRTNEGQTKSGIFVGVNIQFTKEFKVGKLFVGDPFRVTRDSLVAHGKLKKPYTGTKEYTEILKNQIKYWDGDKFVEMYKE